LQLSWAHGAWLAALFVWMVLFWWWQFRLLGLLKAWTLGHYFFIILYAVLLFLLAVILVPSDWASTDSLNVYFLSKRWWFYETELNSYRQSKSVAFLVTSPFMHRGHDG